jgi:hypothetical protein
VILAVVDTRLHDITMPVTLIWARTTAPSIAYAEH